MPDITRRRAACLVAIVVIALLVAGCGGQAADSTTAGAPATTATATTVEPTTTTKPPATPAEKAWIAGVRKLHQRMDRTILRGACSPDSGSVRELPPSGPAGLASTSWVIPASGWPRRCSALSAPAPAPCGPPIRSPASPCT